MENIQLFVKNPEKDFTRNRKLPFQQIMNLILALEKETISNELFKYFGYKADIIILMEKFILPIR